MGRPQRPTRETTIPDFIISHISVLSSRKVGNLWSLTACRHRRCVLRVEVPRKELFVHLSSTGKQRLSNQGLKFPMGKAAGRNASEPRRSLVTYLEMPTLWSEGEGRSLRDSNEHPPSGSSGVAGAACGGRDTVQDGRPTAVRGQPATKAYKGDRNRRGLSWESEGFIVLLEGLGQQNPA
jgi:hypothetical protein